MAIASAILLAMLIKFGTRVLPSVLIVITLCRRYISCSRTYCECLFHAVGSARAMELLGVDSVLSAAFENVMQWQVLLIIAIAAAYGILVGSIPGLTATMAVALIVPLTFI